MAQLRISFKRLAIDKATKKILVTLIGGAVLTVFALAGSRALFAQLKYQNRVIGAKKDAATQLKKNTESVDTLVAAYRGFDDAAESVIGTADKNSKIILNALPSKYDFPALTASLEKILQGFNVESITGSDDEIAQQTVGGSQVVDIPFEVTLTSSYGSIQTLVTDFERSIRPMHLTYLELSGDEGNMRVNLKAKTYYQSAKRLEIKTKVIQ